VCCEARTSVVPVLKKFSLCVGFNMGAGSFGGGGGVGLWGGRGSGGGGKGVNKHIRRSEGTTKRTLPAAET